MRFLSLAALLLVVLFLCGCAREQSAPPPEYAALPAVASTTPGDPAGQKLIVTPGSGLNGRVARVERNLRFVVLTFPVGQMPDLNRRLNVYRQGLKVGEVSITGPQNRDSIVADITAGDAEPGDEVR